MKKMLILLSMVVSLSNVTFAQSVVEVTSATTLLPFVTATRLIQAGAATITLTPLVTTLSTIQARGVAGKEQLKDELVDLNEDMAQGLVNSLEEVRQPALKELFAEIARDEEQMAQINSVLTEGSDLYKVATSVTLILLAQ